MSDSCYRFTGPIHPGDTYAEFVPVTSRLEDGTTVTECDAYAYNGEGRSYEKKAE